MKRVRRGFTVLEVLVCLALLGLAGAFSMQALGRRQVTEHSKALAEVLADKFRQAREQAVATGVPTGIAFPPGQSMYFLQGPSRGTSAARYVWGREFARAEVFTGIWSLPAPAQWVVHNGLEGSPTLALGSWAPRPTDAVYVYLPSGQLIANRPSVDGCYPVVVTLGSTTQSATVGAQTVLRLTGAAVPWTVSLHASGQIELAAGVSQSVGLTTLSPGRGPTPGDWFPPRSGNSDPDLATVQPCPPPPPASLPDGFDASVTPGGYITFAAYATDSEADTLRCDWTTTGGALSSVAESEMIYNSDLQQWVSHWTFTPPPDAEVNDEYTLTCTVRDGRGGSVTKPFGVAGRILVTRPQKLVYLSDMLTGSPTQLDLFVSNTDGTERRRIGARAGVLLSPRWAPDGSRIIYLQGNGTAFAVRSVNPDGSSDREILNPLPGYPEGYSAACFNFAGNRVLALGRKIVSGRRTFDLLSVDVDGSDPWPTLYSSPVDAFPSWNGLTVHPTTGYVLIAVNGGDYVMIDPVRGAPVEIPVTQAQNFNKVEMCFSTDGNWLFFSADNTDLYRAPFRLTAGTPPQAEIGTAELLPTPPGAQTPSVGTDPDLIYYQREIVLNTKRALARYSISNRRSVDLGTTNCFEDDCWVTTYPDVEP